MIEPLGKEDARALLSAHHYGRLGCCHKGEPYVLPINYLYTGEDIYMHSLPGLKIQAMRAHPQICLQVDEVKDDYNWRSVIAFGTYEEIANAAERQRWIAELLQRTPHMTPVQSQMTSRDEEAIVFCLRINRITGVSEHWQ
ncbi:MAG TPA: pyridoxamine 5'-phosphate oxidase family protein [Blastocatellia bacterium]|nr:pyridoxamine 5'-phosphate oxidase family protein [Blastocatellia bacterium]